MAYDLIKISALPAATPDESQEIVVGVGDYAKRINYGDVKNDMVGTSPTYTTDTEPYLTRQTAHVGVVGKCALNKLVGGSLGWNQLVPKSATSGTISGVTFTNNNDGTWSVSGTTTSGNVFLNLDYVAGTKKYINGHVYAMSGMGGSVRLQIVNDGSGSTLTCESATILKLTVTGNAASWARLQILNASTSVNTTVTPQIFDLTLAFGSTIADYIYQLETSSSGSGIVWLRKYIDIDSYHANDSGSIQSVQATEHVTLSKNFLTDYEGHGSAETINGVMFTRNGDGTITLNGTATADVTYYLAVRQRNFYLPKGSYILSGTPTGYSQYTLRLGINRGADGATIGNDLGSGFAFTEATGETYGVWIAFDSGAVFNNVVMKPMIRFATADSTYVPYQKHTYPLGSDTLRGYPMLVNNKLAFDGDIKTPDGKIRRRYGIVDLGSQNWNIGGTGTYRRFYTSETNLAKAPSTQDDDVNIICDSYVASPFNTLLTTDKRISINTTGAINISDSAYASSTGAQFKTAMSGKYLVYEKATESTESSTAYQKIQTIDADGTESFTTSSPVPVGHETQTPDNILAALGWLGE